MNSMSDTRIGKTIMRKTYEDIDKGEQLLNTLVEAFCEAVYLDPILWRTPKACEEAEAAKTDRQVAQTVGADAPPSVRREAITVAIQSVHRRVDYVNTLRPRHDPQEGRHKRLYDHLDAYVGTAVEWANSSP